MKNLRKVLMFAVMLGALALTVRGEVRAVAPLLGIAFGVVLAAVFALSTLLALNEVIEGKRHVRLWAWVVLLLAGGMELGLNTWDALAAESLPRLAAIAVGAGPVVLAGLLSHLVALAVTDTPTTHTEHGRTAQWVPTSDTTTAATESVPRTAEHTTPAPVRPTRTRTASTGTARRSRTGTASRTDQPARKPVATDEQLLAVLSYPELVARDDEGFVSVRRAVRELGCGPDRARKLLRTAELLRPTDTDDTTALTAA